MGNFRERRGFTLIELLIVVAIIAILAAIAVPNFLESQTRTKVARVRADMRALATGIEAYNVDHNYYPLNGIIAGTGTIQNPQTNGSLPAAHKYLNEGLTTPVSYVSGLFTDIFVEQANVSPTWKTYFPRHFYTNFDWFTRIMEPSPLPVIAQKKAIYGTWVLAGAGPDRDRLDLARDLYYDPTNGTISDGDVIRSPKLLR